MHPNSLVRFVERVVGSAAAGPHIVEMPAYWQDAFTPAVVREPLGDHEFLQATRARTRLLTPLLEAAGIGDFPCIRYHEIAQTMLPENLIRRLSRNSMRSVAGSDSRRERAGRIRAGPRFTAGEAGVTAFSNTGRLLLSCERVLPCVLDCMRRLLQVMGTLARSSGD